MGLANFYHDGIRLPFLFIVAVRTLVVGVAQNSSEYVLNVKHENIHADWFQIILVHFFVTS